MIRISKMLLSHLTLNVFAAKFLLRVYRIFFIVRICGSILSLLTRELFNTRPNESKHYELR